MVDDGFVTRLGCWAERALKQKAHENSDEMDERAAEVEVDMQPCWPSQAIFIHYMVHKTRCQPNTPWHEAGKQRRFKTKAMSILHYLQSLFCVVAHVFMTALHIGNRLTITSIDHSSMIRPFTIS